MNNKLIISLDGGGVRGVISLRILDRLQEMLQIDLTLHTHIWAGTSVGGISALAMASGLHPIHHLLGSTEEWFDDIFRDSFRDDMKDLGKLRGAEYGLKGLKGFANYLFGEMQMGELGESVVIPTIKLHRSELDPPRWAMKIYHNLAGEGDDDELVRDVAVMTAAAPTYFPSYAGHVDGGLVANNPSLIAIGAASDPRNVDHIPHSQINLLSIGTGLQPRFIKGFGSKDWGAWQWKDKIIPLIMDVQVEKDAFLARQMLGGRAAIEVESTPDVLVDGGFCRVQPILTRGYGLDSVEAVDELLAVADKVEIGAVGRWLERVILSETEKV